MLLRQDYIDNRIERVERNLTFLKDQYSSEKDEVLKESAQRVLREYLELVRFKHIIDDKIFYSTPKQL